MKKKFAYFGHFWPILKISPIFFVKFSKLAKYLSKGENFFFIRPIFFSRSRKWSRKKQKYLFSVQKIDFYGKKSVPRRLRHFLRGYKIFSFKNSIFRYQRLCCNHKKLGYRLASACLSQLISF